MLLRVTYATQDDLCESHGPRDLPEVVAYVMRHGRTAPGHRAAGNTSL
jgi:hypothetical protein